ncbi:MAG: Hsp70 family protein, partial [Candidatus Aenigmarchaeota archaeon]|nr:Hsp70 family protein [Candidatus Aenigmarchaeota archaeon]
SAKDMGTGKEQKISIKPSSGLSDDDVETMVKNAEAHADEDKKKKDAIEVRNQAETLINTSEKLLKDSGDKVDKGTKKKIEAAVKDLKDVIADDKAETDKIKEKTEALTNVVHELTTKMYQDAQAAAEAQAKGKDDSDSGKKPSKKDDETVVDAEYKVDDEEKKK